MQQGNGSGRREKERSNKNDGERNKETHYNIYAVS
jgi:hypothetical protein